MPAYNAAQWIENNRLKANHAVSQLDRCVEGTCYGVKYSTTDKQKYFRKRERAPRWRAIACVHKRQRSQSSCKTQNLKLPRQHSCAKFEDSFHNANSHGCSYLECAEQVPILGRPSAGCMCKAAVTFHRRLCNDSRRGFDLPLILSYFIKYHDVSWQDAILEYDHTYYVRYNHHSSSRCT